MDQRIEQRGHGHGSGGSFMGKMAGPSWARWRPGLLLSPTLLPGFLSPDSGQWSSGKSLQAAGQCAAFSSSRGSGRAHACVEPVVAPSFSPIAQRGSGLSPLPPVCHWKSSCEPLTARCWMLPTPVLKGHLCPGVFLQV